MRSILRPRIGAIRSTCLLTLAAATLGGTCAMLARADEQSSTSEPATTQKVSPVDFRKLKEWVPAELSGEKRSKVEGEKLSFGEFISSVARAEYGKEADENNQDPPSLRLEVTDYGAMPSMAEMMAAWSKVEIDREGDDGFERTRKVADKYPIHEQFTKDGQQGTISAFVGDRFIVQVTTQNIAEEQFKKIAEKLPLDKLAELK